MAVEIKQYTPLELNQAVIKTIVDQITSHANESILFIISGGSCLNLLGGIYSGLVAKGVQKLNLKIAFGDERLEYEHSNAKDLQEKYKIDLENLNSLGAVFISLQDRSELSSASNSYEQLFNNLLRDQKQQNGLIITLLGMGKDGHIASIFPHSNPRIFFPLYLDTAKLIVGHPYGKDPMINRITLSFPGLLSLGEIYVYISGAEKEKVLKEALFSNPPINENPALFFTLTKNSCQIFTDLKL